MVAEVVTSLAIFKTLLDMAKGLKDINDATVRNAAVIELQEKIFAAHVQQTTLVERVRELEEQMAHFEAWDAEKQKYELKQVYSGAFAYVLKPKAGGGEPPHWLCTTCYQNNKKAILQAQGRAPDKTFEIYGCPQCKSTMRVHYNVRPGKERTSG